MSAPDRRLIVLLVLLVSGCASTSAPQGWLPTAEQAGQAAYGGWAEITTAGGLIEGELIAVGEDSVFVLPSEGTLRGLAKGEVARAEVAYAESRWKALAAWGAVGTLSTISHGAFLLFSFPAWLLAGIETARLEAKGHMRFYPRQDWNVLAPYARFPQGLPAGLDRRALRPR